jgi:hypothetical protein
MGLLHHRSGYEAADSHSGEHLDRPDHGAPVEIGLSEHSVIRHVQPLAIEKHPIVAVDDFPIAIQHGRPSASEQQGPFPECRCSNHSCNFGSSLA